MSTTTPSIPPRLARLIRLLVTLIMVAVGAWAVWHLWDHYELSPWTRDGRVRVNVVQMAPDVSGLVTQVPVHDNEYVKAGALLFQVDTARYALALRQAQATLSARQVALKQAQRERDRNVGLGALVAKEQLEQADTRVEQLAQDVTQAKVALDAAQLNLDRTVVRAPVEGMVTNLDVRVGGYVSTGHPVLALVDSRSYYVEGYFEETKLPRIRLGARAKVIRMGGGQPLMGTVVSVVAAIADHDRTTAANLLPAVNPTFNWVRLPQRIPVRVQLDNPLPSDTPLVAGETVTVVLAEPGKTGADSAEAASAPASAAASGGVVAPSASLPASAASAGQPPASGASAAASQKVAHRKVSVHTAARQQGAHHA
jgi:RND family efflux transporter MFP subunit